MLSHKKMIVACLDFEGVIIPEIWHGLAKLCNIDDLKLTTRDIADYDELMRYRLKICDQYNLTLRDIHKVVEQMEPLDGAFAFLTWYFMGEGINTKTMVSLALAFALICVQLLWK